MRASKNLSMATAGHLLSYDRKRVSPGMVHLGVGAFHRAHVAVYVDSMLPREPDWGIIGASLRKPDTRNALQGQDFLYSLAVRSEAKTETRIIGSLLDVVEATSQVHDLLKAMCDERTRIVSLTVTEKGYCHDPATGELDLNHPDIRHDLANPGAPKTAPGLIVRALELRQAAGIAPFTVLSCDNLPSNGRTVGRIAAALAEQRNSKLALHIREHVAFPSTMIDRIVPATTDKDRQTVADESGFWDAWPVVTEPFSQWVIEDRFTNGRPGFESVGVEFVGEVAPFELMKLRMLNGSHSTLAYLGYLAGHEYISQVVAHPEFRFLANQLMAAEAAPTLTVDVGQLARYREQLLARFANPALKHRTWQIAMDGSQKLPQRLLGTIRDNLAAGREITCASLGVAAWMRYVAGIDERGQPIDVRDPLAARLRDIFDLAGRNPMIVTDQLLAVREVFGDDLPRSEMFRSTIASHLSQLFEIGAEQTVLNVLRA